MRHRNRILLGTLLAATIGTLATQAHSQKPTSTMSTEDRQQYLQNLLQILPPVPSFDVWLQKTHTLPPDYNALPRQNPLPDPLTFLDGRTVTTPAQWEARRKEIADLSQQYVWGTFPARPTITHTTVLNETHENGYTVRNLRVEFGPDSKGTMRIRVYVPDGKGPFPVLINSSLQGWAPQLLRRGYISAGYAGNDAMDDADALAQLYPNNDFALLPRRAWAASLVVDYLETLPQVDTKRIAMYGYSRDGKMASIAAAMDTRISALIAGSTGVGGLLPWRSSGERGGGEGIESTTRSFPTWFAPQLRFFAGREDRLPVDGNLLAAMIAPRPLLIEWGNNDQVASTWGNEQAFYSAQKVYKLLGVPDRIGMTRVPGFHGAIDEESCLDWLDIQFGRSPRHWSNNLIFQWNWNEWRANSKQSLDLSKFPKHEANDILKSSTGGTIASIDAWQKKSAELHESVLSMLGKEPPLVPLDPTVTRKRPTPPDNAPNPGQVTPNLPTWVIGNGGTAYGWREPEKNETAVRHITFGVNLKGDLYYPKNTPEGKKLSTVIWLHGYNYPLGYMWVYHEDLHPILALVHAGYAVLAYDQSGFGSRLSETGPFYDRYPQWSHMGRLVEDVHSAVNTLTQDPLVNPDHIYLFGYALGGTVAMYAGALDSRIKGTVAIAGFTPMRTDTMDRGTGGVARYSQERSLIPTLGFFIGHESQIPYDYQHLLGMMAPHPVLVVEPQLDRDATQADVKAAVDQAKQVYALYGAADKLAIKEPWDYNRLPTKTQNEIIEWMKVNLP